MVLWLRRGAAVAAEGVGTAVVAGTDMVLQMAEREKPETVLAMLQVLFEREDEDEEGEERGGRAAGGEGGEGGGG